MSKPIIEVRNVSKCYRLGGVGMTSLRDDVQRLGRWVKNLAQRESTSPAVGDKSLYWALNDVSFDIQPGEIVGLIGRNGAGKSTMLKVLSRITEPSSGEIKFRGRLGSLLEVGTGFHPELSGRDNIFLNGAILGMKRHEVLSKLKEIIEFSEIGDFLDTPVKRYSSGMYVKLAFAVAAHLEPEVLLIDEVLAVGDASFQKKCLDRMQAISSGEGRTILFVSHSMVSIRRLCQKCVVLEKGRLKGVLPVEQAIDVYLPKGEISDYSIDLETLPRAWGTEGKLARSLRIRVLSPSGIRFGAPLSLEVTFVVREPIRNGMIGLGVNSLDGSRVMTIDTDAGGKGHDWTPGVWTSVISLDRMPVSTGRYMFSLAIGGTAMYDIVDSFAVWEVQSSASDNESDRGFGGCRLAPNVIFEQK